MIISAINVENIVENIAENGYNVKSDTKWYYNIIFYNEVGES